MRLTFIIPTTYFSGGTRVVYEQTQQLLARGHQVQIIYPLVPYFFGFWWSGRSWLKWLNCWRRNLLNQQDTGHYKVSLKRVWRITDRYVPTADVILATAWPTAFSVSQLAPDKGRKFYFVQHYETWSGPLEKVDQTWRLPDLKLIVISQWLKDLAAEKFHRSVGGPVSNGVNFDLFFNSNKKFNRLPVVGLIYNSLAGKGFNDGYRAFLIVKKRYPSVRLFLAGKNKNGAPLSDKFYYDPTPAQLREFYCACDIFVSPSWSEGYNLPPMEAMACGCAVVATKVGAVADYSQDQITALHCSPRQPEQLAEKIIELLADAEKLRQIAATGQQAIKKFTWAKAADQLLAAINEDSCEKS